MELQGRRGFDFAFSSEGNIKFSVLAHVYKQGDKMMDGVEQKYHTFFFVFFAFVPVLYVVTHHCSQKAVSAII